MPGMKSKGTDRSGLWGTLSSEDSVDAPLQVRGEQSVPAGGPPDTWENGLEPMCPAQGLS